MTARFSASSLLAGGFLGLAGLVAIRRLLAPRLVAGPGNGLTADGHRGGVVALLPVRDEEGNVAGCVDGLLAQTVPVRVVVVDDGSRDGTRAIVEQRARDEERLEVIAAGELPPGWAGKVHALAVGEAWVAATAPDAEWLLSTDADARHDPELLGRALATAQAYGLDALSVAGHQRVEGAVENLLTPAVFALLVAELGSWRAAAAGEGPAVANGQLILVRRRALATAGGFAALRGAALDDVALARRLRAAGSRTGFFRALDLLRVRMYRGGGAAVAGWRRNLGAIFGPRPVRAAAIVALLLAPPLAILALLLDRRPRAALALWSAGAGASALLRVSAGHRAGWALLHPADAVLLAGTLALGTADWRRGRLAAWKGRRVEAR